jgi:hypothetical protein
VAGYKIVLTKRPFFVVDNDLTGTIPTELDNLSGGYMCIGKFQPLCCARLVFVIVSEQMDSSITRSARKQFGRGRRLDGYFLLVKKGDLHNL